MKKVVSLVLVLLIVLNSVAYSVALSKQFTSQDAINAVIDWAYERNEDFYDLKNVKATIKRITENGTSKRFYILLEYDAKIKYEDVEENPFIIGIRSAEQNCDIKFTSNDKAFLNEYIDTFSEYIGSYYPCTVDIVVEYIVSEGTRSLYYQDPVSTYLYPISIANLDYDEIFENGVNAFSDIMQIFKSNQNTQKGYSLYKRVTARNYANSYSSNPTYCHFCGSNSTCDALIDGSYWNNTDYPITGYPALQHGDCADFVSQCMYAGGLPVDPGHWERFRDGGAWANELHQQTYMVDNGYWDSSTYNTTNAGNICGFKNGSDTLYHVVLVTVNDGVDHRYTGHTNDRMNLLYFDNSSQLYYVIKSTGNL